MQNRKIWQTTIAVITAAFLTACGAPGEEAGLSSISPRPTQPNPTSPTPTSVLPVDIIISWNANPEADLKGYKVYHGSATADLTEHFFVGKEATSFTYTVQNEDSADQYFAISAVDNADNESVPTDLIYINARGT